MGCRRGSESAWVRKCVEVGRHVGQGEKMHRCGAKGMVGAQDVRPSNTCLPLTAGVASGRTVGVAWVAGRRAGGDLSNIRKKISWRLGFGCGKVAVQRLAGVVGFRCPLPYEIDLKFSSPVD